MEFVWVILIIFIVLFVLLIKGVIKTFQRNAIVAILCFIFVFPVLLAWAFFELFTGEISKN